MRVEEAKKKVCPFINHAFAFNPDRYSLPVNDSSHANINCIGGECMAWVSTVDGKKEIDRIRIPYEIYPMEEGRMCKELINDGYIEVERKLYIKYEEAYEGYCARVGNGEV